MAGLYKTVAAGKGDVEGRDLLAESIGFTYSEYPLEDYVDIFKDFELFQIGFEKQPYNYIEGKWDGIHWKIFDYKYKEATGKYGSESYCTVMYADLERYDVSLPCFYGKRVYLAQSWQYVG